MSKETLKSQTSWLAYFGNLSISTIGGTIIGGAEGGGVASLATITDEFLINKGYISKHYLTSTALWSSLVIPAGQGLAEIFPEWTWPIYGASAATIGAFTYYGNDSLNYQERLDEIIDDMEPMVKLFDDKNILSKQELYKVICTTWVDPASGLKLAAEDLFQILTNRFLITTAATNVLDLFNVGLNAQCNKYIGNDGTTMLALTLINQNPSAGLAELSWKGLKVCSLLFAKGIISTLIKAVNGYLNSSLESQIEAKAITQTLLKEEHLAKLLTMKDAAGIISHLHSDFSILSFQGRSKLTNITTAKVQEFIDLREIMAIAPEGLIITCIKGFVRKKAEKKIFEKTNEDLDKQTELSSDKCLIKADLCNNFSNAVITDSMGLISDKCSIAISDSSVIANKRAFWLNLGNIFNGLLDTLSTLTDTIYAIYKLTSGQITLEQAPLMVSWFNSVSPLLQGGFTIQFTCGPEAKKRVTFLLETLRSNSKEDVATRELNDQGKIIVTDYCLKKSGQELLKINHLEFENKHYAISGKSGLGKSTFLKDLIKCLTDPFSSSGVISLPGRDNNQAKTMLIDQKLYIPAKATLFEAITLKSSKMIDADTKLSLEKDIISLLNQLMGKEDGARNWESEINNPAFDANTLSGGECKKIGVIKAILAKPEILIMDEVFVGLDAISLDIIQRLITKELPDTIILVVDHKALDNNKNHFYNAEIHFEPGSDFEIISFDPESASLIGDV
jgi:ABC-type nitrate/sulfonate/bicarbonate transport system ATPase subunit